MEQKGSLTIVENAYHQLIGEESTRIESRYEVPLFTDEQPYIRRTKVGEKWETIDTGWVKDPRMIWIHNEEGKFTQVNPTKEERKESDKRIIGVTFNSFQACSYACLDVYPGQSIRICPSGFYKILVKSQHGTAKYTLTALPK